MSLSNKAMLVTLAISQWSARKFDKNETAALAAKHGTPTEVARVNKSLLPFAASLDLIHKKTNEARWWYYRNSLPWGQEGVNIIKSDGYLAFVQGMRQHMDEWRKMVGDFVAEYPKLREDARLMLNGMYREDDYPDPCDIAGKFTIDCRFAPVPDADNWIMTSMDEDMAELREQLRETEKQGLGIAMADIWKQVYEVVEKAHTRLADPKGVFRDSLVENAAALCRLLPQLNLTDDPHLDQMRREIENSLCKHAPDTLREAPDVREKVANEMQAIMDKMAVFYPQGGK